MNLKALDRRTVAAILAAVLAIALAVGFGLSMRDDIAGTTDQTGRSEPKQTIKDACASSTTLRGLKQLVFAQAGDLRTLERVNFDILAAGAIVRMEDPVARGHDASLDLTRCSGRFILELPPGAEVAFNGDRRLVADVIYEVQAAADGSGPVYRMNGAENIVSRLAAFDMEGHRLHEPAASAADDPLIDAEALPPVTPEPVPTFPPPDVDTDSPRPPPTLADPSFDCRYARTRGELLVCGSDRLAALDRTMAELYGSAMDDADNATRRRLVRTRDAFLDYRDRCRDTACVASAYQGRMREIRDIMTGAY
ncbi:lysozyme inhibitor LprI family protein [Sphingosinicella rhizophila]|uniref:Lysozyme inhibitor LprI N-terminal domain-containing protein n=1 Tax=Sphingosinicella rhizophila TaxID=3050082 RepID=A0ABU3Q3I6_9SPHN|nr:hypothetical protein [Sphingosinicella sp. GR2756]MDT9597520.1 hypothetical protein [Sphingosinicella sp. GR2756]